MAALVGMDAAGAGGGLSSAPPILCVWEMAALSGSVLGRMGIWVLA